MRFFLLSMLASSLYAQSVQIYSELRRVDVDGKIIAADQGGKPREILSPGLIRNAFHSLRVVVTPPKNKWYTLHIAENPEGLQFTIYHELPASPTSKIPDKLEKLKLPVQGRTNHVETYWLDMWVPPTALVRRIRIEVQMHDGETWYIYPMEARVLAGIVPQIKDHGASLPEWEKPAVNVSRQAMREFICSEKPVMSPHPLTVRGLVRRNAMQDVALARNQQLQWGRERLANRLAEVSGVENAEKWCAAETVTSPLGPEWYLRIRDFLYLEASR